MLASASLALLKAAGRRLTATPLIEKRFFPERRLDLDGRVVFITGAARGLGAELARQAHARGAQVALVGRRLEGLQELMTELGEERAAAFEADVTDLAALQRAAADTVARFGGIDVVVANAGIAPPSDTILTIDPDAFEQTVDVDLLGQWRTMRATLPPIIERQGHILVVASIYAFFNGAMNASYAASKAGLEQLTRAARVELAHHGATAGVAYLGFVETDLAADVFAQAHVDEARKAFPAFLTAPIPVERAASALLDEIEERAGRVGAPGWVLPMLDVRSIATGLMDVLMLDNARLSAAIARAESEHAEEDLQPPEASGGA